MRITKIGLINEVIDSNGELIGSDTVPTTGSNIITKSSRTTDYNIGIGHQPMDFSYITKMGMGLPFYEGVEDGVEPKLVTDLSKLSFDRYMEIMKHYYQNPNKLKSDYREMVEYDFESQPDEKRKHDTDFAIEIINVFRENTKESENIDESKIVEDKMVEKSKTNNLVDKKIESLLTTKDIERLAGLLTKRLKGDDIDKLINILETK